MKRETDRHETDREGTDQQRDLVESLDRVVRRIDGVTGLYDARPTAVTAVTAVTALAAVAAAATRLTGRGDPKPVVVSSSDSGLTVSVSLAVSEKFPAAETCRRVFEAVHDTCATQAPEDTLGSVRIRVSRIG